MQQGLFTSGPPAIRPMHGGLRRALGQGAWVEHLPHWLAGQHTLFERLRNTVHWQARRRQMYDRVLDVPRLLGAPPLPLDPLLAQMIARLQAHTGWLLDAILVSLYRDGDDSVAWHGDRVTHAEDCVMAILSLGATRRFQLRPRGGGPSRTLQVQGGDLVILGGTIQSTFEHCVPKERWAHERIAVMFRPPRLPPDLPR